jgi:malate dehydrogenase
VTDIKKVTIWGNHSATQYPDLNHATIKGEPAMDQLDQEWVRNTFIPRVQKRGAEIIEARGMSSAASAAYAGLAQIRDWVNGSESGNWLSMAVPSDGSYDVPEGLVYSFPVTVETGRWEIVTGLDVDDFSREKMQATQKELEEERDAVKDLI